MDTNIRQVRAGIVQFDQLEPRLLLSGADPESSAVVIDWMGQSAYAYPGQWLLGLDYVFEPGTDRVAAVQEMIDSVLPGDPTPPGDATDPSGPPPLEIVVARELGTGGPFLVETPESLTHDKLVSYLSNLPTYVLVEPDFQLSVLETMPNDPMFSELWGLHNTGQTGGTTDADIDAPEAWDLNTGSGQIVVGVIDTGVDYNHTDLAANMWTNPGEIAGDGIDNDGNGYVDDVYGWDFRNNDSDPYDDHSHGTHCAGTIAGIGNNGVGVVGVNWSAQIMALKFLSSGGSGSTSDAVEAVNYATMMRRDYGVNIVLTSNSWGGGGYSTALRDAIDGSGQAGMLFVAAAGNDNDNTDNYPHYPSSYDLPNIISVAATDHNDNRASFSNYGPISVDLGAPGVNVYSTTPGNNYSYKSGTSMATPHVAGVAALAWDTSPGVDWVEVRDFLFANVDPLSSLAGRCVTGGRLNAYRTLEAIGLTVADSDPAADDLVTTPPLDFVIHFSADYDPATVDAADLTVNGIPAETFTLTDSDTVTFHFSVSPVTTQGLQSMSMEAGVMEDAVNGRPLREWEASFRYDVVPMEVVSTVPPDGAIVSVPFTSLMLNFNEPYDPATIALDDLSVDVGRAVGVNFIDPDTVEYVLEGIESEGVLHVEIAADAMADQYGNPMLAYAGQFELDVGTVPYPTPLDGEIPAGSLIYDPTATGSIAFSGDVDHFTLELDAGQTLTAIVAPDGTLRPTVEMTGPSGTFSAVAPGAGQEAVLQTALVTVAGTYTITVGGSGATIGAYELQVVLNAAVEAEEHGGPDNNSMAGAQYIDGSFVHLSGTMQRGAVLGTADGIQPHISQTRHTVYYPNVLTFQLDVSGWAAPMGDGTLQISALADLGSSSEYITLDAEGVVTWEVFRQGGGEGTPCQTQLVVPLADLQALTADGVVTITATPSSPVDNYEPPQTYLTLELSYPVPGTGDFYFFTLPAGQLAAMVLAPHGAGSGVLRLYDASGALLTEGADLVGAQAIYDFAAPSTGFYYVEVGGDGHYGLVVTRNATFDSGPNAEVEQAQDMSYTGAVLGYAGVLPLGGQGATSVISLPTNLYDGTSYLWDIQRSGGISNGTGDAYDGGLYHSGFSSFSSAQGEDGDRELAIGPMYTGSVSVTRKIYVPADQGYARFLEIITNTGGATTAYTVTIQSDMGSDSSTVVVGTSSGDTHFAPDDDWVVTDDSDGGGDPTMLHVIAGPGGQRPLSASFHSSDELTYSWNLSLAPGETQIIMHFASQNPNRSTALAKGDPLADLDLDATSGMSHAERSQVVNFRGGWGGIVDCYRFPVVAGDVVTLQTSTPGDGAGEFVNALDPAIELYDPNGALVFTNDNGAPDGRNALLTHATGLTGWYVARVLSVNETHGEYVLTATGYTGSVPPLTVIATDPADGTLLAAPAPTQMTVQFSEALLLTSLQASDLTVDGTPATGMLALDNQTVIFDLPALGHGVHNVAVATGAVVDLQGTGNEAYAGQFTLDLVAPRVIDSSLQQGDVAPTGTLTYTAQFDEELQASSLGADDVQLIGQIVGSCVPDSFGYDPATRTVTVEYSNLPEDMYTLTLFSGDGHFEDLIGNDFDGEALAWPIPPNTSGDGLPGGDFSFTFELDMTVQPYPTPLELKRPQGSLIYDPSVSGRLSFEGDTDSLTIDLDAGQTLSVVVTPETTIRPKIDLYDPVGALVGSASAAVPGRAAILQTVAVGAGLHTVTISEVLAAHAAVLYAVDAQTDELYTVNLTTGASGLVGALNDDVAFGGLSLDGGPMYVSGLDFPLSVVGTVDTATGQASRIGLLSTSAVPALAHVAGTLYGFSMVGAQTMIGSVDVATGAFTPLRLATGMGVVFGADLDEDSGTLYAIGWPDYGLYTLDVNTGVASLVGPTGVDFGAYAGLACHPSTGELYAMGDDVAGTGDNLYHIDKTTGAASLVGPSGLAMADALEFLVFVPVRPAAYTCQVTLNAALEAEEHGGAPNGTAATAQDIDGSFLPLLDTAERGAVLGYLPPGAGGIPVVAEDFESGLLGPAWTRYSSNANGRIRVTSSYGSSGGSYALWMDRSPDGSYTLNEGVWTVDLSGLTAATLRFSYAEYNDEEESFSGDFTGHYNADGVAISDDGVRWHPIWNAANQSSGTWQEYTFDLAAAAASAGMTLGPNFKIKFQQYDDFALTTDGRGWDDISITTPASADEDWYAFTLEAGQVTTIALTALNTGSVHLELRDGPVGPPPLEVGRPVGTNVDEVIENFTAPSAGTYYARITGGGAYSLVVTRDATFEVEGSPAALDATGIVLAALTSGGASGQDIAMGLIQDNTPWDRNSNVTIGQELGFTVTLIPSSSLGSVDLSGYDLIVMAGDQYSSTYQNVAANMSRVDSFVTAGGVWILNYASGWASGVGTPYQYDLLPGASGVSFAHWTGSDVDILDPASGLITGPGGTITDSNLDGGSSSTHGYTTSPMPTRGNAILSTGNSSQVVTLDYEFGSGHVIVHTMPVEYYNGGPHGIGQVFHRNLFDFGRELARDVDEYTVTVSAGDILEITTVTPGDGAGEFVNELDPMAELYDPSGTLVASDDNSAPDGRNVRLNYLVPIGEDGTYTIRVMTAEGRGEYILRAGRGEAPRVADVLVASADWQAGFLSHLAAQGLGAAGYSVPVGSADQLLALPWVNVDQIRIAFTEDVEVSAGDLTMHGVSEATYAFAGFAYDSNTYTATWTLTEALGPEKIRLALADTVGDLWGNPLDGEWVDETDTYPSGDGMPGGDFRFRFNVLPGDVDQNGLVNIFDTIKTRNKQFTAPGTPTYSALHDVDGSGAINIFDTIKVRNRQFTTLPAGEPAAGGVLAITEPISAPDVLDEVAPVVVAASSVSTGAPAGEPSHGVARAAAVWATPLSSRRSRRTVHLAPSGVGRTLPEVPARMLRLAPPRSLQADDDRTAGAGSAALATDAGAVRAEAVGAPVEVPLDVVELLTSLPAVL